MSLHELATLPAWFQFFVLYFLTIGILPIGRWYFEGEPYNISMASAYGDVALIISILIGADVYARYDPVDSERALQTAFIIVTGVVVVAQIARTYRERAQKTIMDAYHDIVVVPLFLYLVLFKTIPVVTWTGKSFEQVGMWGCIIIWILLMFYDFRTGRLQQQKWLRENGPVTHV